MRIYSGLIDLDYDPATDILVAGMPSMKNMEMSEVRHCLGLIVETIRNYDIKNFLLDSSNSVLEIEDESYKAVTVKFAKDLMATRLKRLARVGTADMVRESKSAKVTAEITQMPNLPVEFRNFTGKFEAMEWLLGKRQ